MRRWSFTVGRICGIDVRVHISFPLFVALIAAVGIGELGVRQGLSGALFVLVVFMCVLLHEISHSIAAVRLGGRVHDIVLLPIGGVARMERIPEAPAAELIMAIVGPTFNFVLAGALFATMPGRVSLGGKGFLSELATVNLALGAFNLLPAFPMDGGRVLRAFLAFYLGRPAATRIAATVGKVFAAILVVVGLRFNPWLIFIGAFVFYGATAEEQIVELQTSLAGLLVRDFMTEHIAAIPADTPLAAVRTLFERSTDRAVLVGDPSWPVGLVRRIDLADVLRRFTPDAPAESFSTPPRGRVAPDAPAECLLPMLAGDKAAWLVVMENDRFSGVVTAESIAERAAWRESSAWRERHRSLPSA